MNTTHLINILSRDRYCKRFFRGVFARDRFVDLDPLVTIGNGAANSHYVLNLDEASEPGSHWVVVDFHKNTGKIFYFDSFGLPPLFDDLLEKLQTDSSSLTFSQTQLQRINTTVCGQYCLLYCILRSYNFSSEYIIDLLYCDNEISPDTRDHIIHEFILKTFPCELYSFDVGVHDINSLL